MRTDLINQTEALVLSSILFNPTLIEDISIKLKPNDFYFLPHKDIYEAMLNLHSEDMPIDEDYIIKKSKKPINQSILIHSFDQERVFLKVFIALCPIFSHK